MILTDISRPLPKLDLQHLDGNIFLINKPYITAVGVMIKDFISRFGERLELHSDEGRYSLHKLYERLKMRKSRRTMRQTRTNT